MPYVCYLYAISPQSEVYFQFVIEPQIVNKFYVLTFDIKIISHDS